MKATQLLHELGQSIWLDNEAEYQDKLLSAMRYQFGGHLEKPAGTRVA